MPPNELRLALMNTERALTHTDPRYLHSDITDISSGAFYRVYNGLRFGFLESVYRNALSKELTRAGVSFDREVPVDVWYDGEKVGHFRADFLVEGRVILEVKASLALTDADRKQLLNYLRGSRVEVGLLLHFGPKPSIKRIIFTNDQKNISTETDAEALKNADRT
jgi:GxxExxY protein